MDYAKIDGVSARLHRADAHADQKFILVHRPELPPAPEKGYRLILVLPGGDGSEAQAAFVQRVHRFALGPETLVAQLVSVRWSEQQVVIWPTRKNRVRRMEFATEDFVGAVIAKVKELHPIDPDQVHLLAWSSGGPAAYAAALTRELPIAGAYVAMSVFKPDELPPLRAARGRAFYIEHSPDDRVCPIWMARNAAETLRKKGRAEVLFATYSGGHGWVGGDPYKRIRTGVEWLAERAGEAGDKGR